MSDKTNEVAAGPTEADILKAIKAVKAKITVLGAVRDGKRKPVEKALTADHILACKIDGKKVVATLADGSKVEGTLS